MQAGACPVRRHTLGSRAHACARAHPERLAELINLQLLGHDALVRSQQAGAHARVVLGDGRDVVLQLVAALDRAHKVGSHRRRAALVSVRRRPRAATTTAATACRLTQRQRHGARSMIAAACTTPSATRAHAIAAAAHAAAHAYAAAAHAASAARLVSVAQHRLQLIVQPSALRLRLVHTAHCLPSRRVQARRVALPHLALPLPLERRNLQQEHALARGALARLIAHVLLQHERALVRLPQRVAFYLQRRLCHLALLVHVEQGVLRLPEARLQRRRPLLGHLRVIDERILLGGVGGGSRAGDRLCLRRLRGRRPTLCAALRLRCASGRSASWRHMCEVVPLGIPILTFAEFIIGPPSPAPSECKSTGGPTRARARRVG